MPFDYLDNCKFTPFSHRGGSIENDENTSNCILFFQPVFHNVSNIGTNNSNPL